MMDMPPDESHPIAVELVCPISKPPLTAPATLFAFEDRQCEVRIRAPIPTLAPDTSVMLRLTERRALEIFGLVAQHEGDRVDVRIVRVSHREKRYFPREEGSFDLKWKRLEGASVEAASQAWRRGLFEVDRDDEWNIPSPVMNFSASGLRFRDHAPCAPGDVLLVTFRPSGQTAWHRATASVVRREPDPRDDAAPPEVAVEFVDIDPASVEALADFTLDRQLDELARHGVTVD